MNEFNIHNEAEDFDYEQEKKLHESKMIDVVMGTGAILVMLIGFLGAIDWIGVI